MKTISLCRATSEHIFISVDGENAIPNDSHPLWRRISEDETTRLLEMTDELTNLCDVEISDPPFNHDPWKSLFEMIVNEAAWGALRALPAQSLGASVEQALERAGIQSDALSFLDELDYANLQCRLVSNAIMALRHGEAVEEYVYQELFGWLEEYTDCLADSLAELIELARSTSETNDTPTLHVWKEEGF